MTKRKSAEKVWEAQQTRERMASCPSGKKRFDTEEFAAKALAKVIRKYDQTREVRFYLDPACGGWHLTKADEGKVRAERSPGGHRLINRDDVNALPKKERA